MCIPKSARRDPNMYTHPPWRGQRALRDRCIDETYFEKLCGLFALGGLYDENIEVN